MYGYNQKYAPKNGGMDFYLKIYLSRFLCKCNFVKSETICMIKPLLGHLWVNPLNIKRYLKKGV